MARDDPKTGVDGSISDIHARLVLWCRRRRRGLARVEFSSEFARQQVMDHLRRDLEAMDIPLHTLELPTWSSPAHVIQYLWESLDALDTGVVSISGFATAFDKEIPLSDALRVLNFNRENLVKPQLAQIWWMTRSFTDKALHAMPDLNSWFTLRLFLTESIRPDGQAIASTPPDSIPTRSIQDATPETQQDAINHHDLVGIIHNLPGNVSRQFIGRDTELVQIHHQLQQSGQMAISAIAGMGGVGKTELALQYAVTYHTSYPGGICWIRARDMDIGTQVIAFAQHQLQLSPPSELDIRQQTQWCWQHWPEPDKDVLLVLDDVNDYERVIPYLPHAIRFKVLMTTRLQSLGAAVATFSLKLLTADAAQALLASIIGEERVSAELDIARQLCAWLGYLPLGIELLGRDLQRNPSLSLHTVYQQLQARQAEYGAHRRVPPGMSEQIPLAVVFDTTWRSLSTQAQWLGCLLSCFALAPIPWFLVRGCFSAEAASEVEHVRVAELVSLGLLRHAGDHVYQLHPLIYQFLGMQREQTDWSDTLKRTFCLEMVKVAKSIPDTPTRTQIVELTPTIPHLVEAATTWQRWLTDDDLIWPFVGLGRFYEGQGDYSDAEPWFELCSKIVGDRLGTGHPDVATSLNNLAELYRLQGRYSEAEPLLRDALTLRQQLLGDTHPDVAISLNNLASLYYSQGRYGEAEPLYRNALHLRQQLLGHDHPDVATSLNNLAGLYKSQKRFSEAEPLYRDALDLRQQLLGDEHPDVATSLNNLADLYESQGRYREAEPLYRDALDLRQRLLGDEHPDVATSLNNLALLYKAQGRYHEAEPLYAQAFSILYQRLGDDHPSTKTVFGNFMSCLQDAINQGEGDRLADYPVTRFLLSTLLSQNADDDP